MVQRPFQCRLCSSNFGRSSHLIAHMRSHQTDGKKEYPCDECERVFWTNQHLKKHKDLHDPDASVKTYNVSSLDLVDLSLSSCTLRSVWNVETGSGSITC
jgi:uncharacterized Zn-finger protein